MDEKDHQGRKKERARRDAGDDRAPRRSGKGSCYGIRKRHVGIIRVDEAEKGSFLKRGG